MSSDSSSGGHGIATIITVVFVVLKLIGFIDWEWWWVLSPLLIEAGLLAFLVVSLGLAKWSDPTWTDDPDAGEPAWTWKEPDSE